MIAKIASVCGTIIVVAAVSTHAAGHSERSMPSSATASVAFGRKLFLSNCAPCHGDDARGDDGPNLHEANLASARIESVVKSGIKDEMPSFEQKLKPNELKAIVEFVRSLQ